MKFNKSNGVTLTLLVVTILVMLILFSITISTSGELIKNSQKSKLKTMLYMVETRAEILLEEYLFEIDETSLDSVSDEEIENYLGGEYINNQSKLLIKKFVDECGGEIPPREHIIFCLWNEATLRSQGIDTKNLANGDIVVIKYDLINKEIDVASKNGVIDSDGILKNSLKEL